MRRRYGIKVDLLAAPSQSLMITTPPILRLSDLFVPVLYRSAPPQRAHAALSDADRQLISALNSWCCSTGCASTLTMRRITRSRHFFPVILRRKEICDERRETPPTDFADAASYHLPVPVRGDDALLVCAAIRRRRYNTSPRPGECKQVHAGRGRPTHVDTDRRPIVLPIFAHSAPRSATGVLHLKS